MPLPLLGAPFVIPIGTAIGSVVMYLFRFAVVRIAVNLAFFAVIAMGGYLVAAWLLPEWLSLETLRLHITGLSPGVSYGLHLISFYEGFPLVLTAIASAWVLKKIPNWVWLGPLFRLFKTGD